MLIPQTPSPAYLNNKGISLIEAMIVTVIISILGLGFMTMMSNVNKQQKMTEIRSNVTDFKKKVESNLNHEISSSFNSN